MATDDNKQPYSGKKFKAALMLSEGIKTQKEIAKEVNTTTVTISRWKQDPEYKALIDKLTLENDLASRAGLLRAMYKGASLKEDNIKNDKSTHLDYMKGIAKVQGLESQNVNVTGEVSIKKIEIATSKREDAD